MNDFRHIDNDHQAYAKKLGLHSPILLREDIWGVLRYEFPDDVKSAVRSFIHGLKKEIDDQTEKLGGYTPSSPLFCCVEVKRELLIMVMVALQSGPEGLELLVTPAPSTALGDAWVLCNI